MKKNWVWILFLIGIGFFIGWNITKSVFEHRNIVVMAGSVAMETFAMGIEEKVEQLRKEKNIYGEKKTRIKEKGIDFEVVSQFIGSSAGMEALLNGSAQIAMVSRYLTEEEKQKGMVENIVAYDSIVIVVNRKNPIDNLSKEQLVGLFSGKIGNWKQLGGIDEPVIPIGRELGSGTRDAFEGLLGIEGKSVYANECDSIGIVKEKVSLFLGAIGYVSYEVALEPSFKQENGVKIVSIEQIFPTKENIANGDYFLTRPFSLVTKGTIENQVEEVQEIFNLLSSKQGEIIFEKAKVVPAREKFTQGRENRVAKDIRKRGTKNITKERVYSRGECKSFYKDNGIYGNWNGDFNYFLSYL